MRVLYKCRLCGKTYSDTAIPNSIKNVVMSGLIANGTVRLVGGYVDRYDSHICEQGNPDRIGFADFVGLVADKEKK